MRDLRHALRAVARMPTAAAVIVVSLAAGIGVNTVVYSWIQAVVRASLAPARLRGEKRYEYSAIRSST